MAEWQPIETAPKNGTRFLFANGLIIGVGFFINGKHFAADSFSDQQAVPPTHWMPLPPLPE